MDGHAIFSQLGSADAEAERDISVRTAQKRGVRMHLWILVG